MTNDESRLLIRDFVEGNPFSHQASVMDLRGACANLGGELTAANEALAKMTAERDSITDELNRLSNEHDVDVLTFERDAARGQAARAEAERDDALLLLRQWREEAAHVTELISDGRLVAAVHALEDAIGERLSFEASVGC